ncbi:MAG TPA: division/cell wall cluster transcriptional repressor MraZ [Acidimicrobiia bacterium]|nr:division/cell wall cluster transcriptional repressor MraZ [Acidimicrobiia bacterium]
MFLGEFQHSLDAKGRVILPAKFRDQLAGGAFVAKGRDGCLFVYTAEEFEQVAQQAREASRRGDDERQAARSFFAGAADVVPDKQGRVAIPQHLRDYAGLDRDVVVAGVFSRIEIWDSGRWRERDRLGEQALTTSENLPDFGI